MLFRCPTLLHTASSFQQSSSPKLHPGIESHAFPKPGQSRNAISTSLVSPNPTGRTFLLYKREECRGKSQETREIIQVEANVFDFPISQSIFLQTGMQNTLGSTKVLQCLHVRSKDRTERM
jgi:hypothetical protein